MGTFAEPEPITESLDEPELTYKDEDGTKLYGYSQDDLKRLIIIGRWIASLLTILLAWLLFITYLTMKYHLVTKLINSCG